MAIGLAVALVIALPTLLGLSLASIADAHPSAAGPSLRVSALRDDNGTVQVSLQVLGADGEWGERLLPTRRVISGSAPSDTWLRSSPLTIERGNDQVPLFCVVAHGAADDHFWLQFRAFLYQSARLSQINVRFETHLRGEDQAAAIERCISDGAAVIASTLASPAHVREPLIKAKEAGARVATFNAGVEHAASVGSEIHIALNDRAAGELAGRQLNERGISGQVGCIIHELDNLSLERRCDGLEAAYQGAGITRIQLEEVAADRRPDHGTYIEHLASMLSDGQGPRYHAVLTLNADTLGHVLAATQQLGEAADGLLISSVGSNTEDVADFPADWLAQRLGVLINDNAGAQGFFVASALQFSHVLHIAPHISLPQVSLADPSVFDYRTAAADAEALAAIAQSLGGMLEQSSGSEGRAGGVDVRIAALKRVDGSVVVAIESLGPDGRWSSRQLPQRRVLPADAPSRRWLASSAVELPGAAEQTPLFCVVVHGAKSDRYWQAARAYMHISAHVTNTNWRYEAHLDGADQAAAIDECSADGAAVIASTLADPEAVTQSLLAAKAAGARIVTFNSGAAFAAAAGSEIHIALDDRVVGEASGRRINDLGTTGTVACVLHEEGNVGLEERCEGLEAAYNRANVVRLQLTEGATEAQLVSELVDGLTTDAGSPEIELALILNVNTLYAALDAAVQIHADSGHAIKLVGIGTHSNLSLVPLETRRRHLYTTFNDSVESQGFFVISAMHFVHNHPTPPEFIGRPEVWLATPFDIDPSRLRAHPELARKARETFFRYVAEADADDG